MFRVTPAIAALAATTMFAAISISGDASARPGGGRGGHAGSFRGGAVGFHGAGVYRGGAAGFHHYNGAVGRRGVVVRGGAYRVGGRYHGGIWYGTGRHWWNGRWYGYGVGPCWLWSPIGYVWICG